MSSIEKIEGIGKAFQKKMVAYGVKTEEALLKQGATPAGGEKKLPQELVSQKP